METRRGTYQETDTDMGDLTTEAVQRDDFAVGVIMFAAVMLMITGGFHVISGLAAIIEDQFFVLTREYVYEFDVTTWGWIHLVAGIVAVIAGIGLFSGNVLARIAGVAVATLSMIANFMFLPWFPLWSVLIIAIDIVVIWALLAHGREITKASW